MQTTPSDHQEVLSARYEACGSKSAGVGIRVIATALVLVVGFVSPGQAITIHILGDGGDTSGGDTSGRPGLSGWGWEVTQRRDEIVRAAADYWENIFPDNDNIEFYVDCVWKDRSESRMCWVEAGIEGTDSRPDVWTRKGLYHGRIMYRIKFQRSDDYDYFMDDSPWDHSEFDMQQTVYGDLSADTAADWFEGVPSPYFDVSYSGTAPETLEDGSANLAYDAPDLYSYALRELGVVLGMREAAVGKSDAEKKCKDGYFDVDSSFDVGLDVGIIAPWDEAKGKYVPGIEADSLMSWEGDGLGGDGSTEWGERWLPAMTDILAIAAINEWTSVRLPRIDMIGSGSVLWNDDANWQGGRQPSDFTTAYIRDEAIDSAYLDDDAETQNLFVGEGIRLSVGSHHLRVLEHAQFDDAEAFVDSGGALVATTMTLDAASLTIHPEGRAIVASQVTVESDGTITVEGTPPVEGAPDGSSLRGVLHFQRGGLDIQSGGTLNLEWGLVTGDEIVIQPRGTLVEPMGAIRGMGELTEIIRLENSGRIVAALEGSLEFRAKRDVPTSFDLDGLPQPSRRGGEREQGEIDAREGSILFDGPMAENDPFDGVMRIGTSVTLTDSWKMGGNLYFSRLEPQLEAVATEISGHVEVSGEADATILGEIFFEDSATVAVPELLGTLTLEGDTTFRGGTFEGSGTIYQRGAVVVEADTTITMENLPGGSGDGVYVWDGQGPSLPGTFDTTINENVTFSIHSGISRTLGDGYDGTVTVQSGGTLFVEPAWVLDEDGSIVLEDAHLGLLNEDGTMSGGQVTSYGLLTGEGAVYVDFINNEGGGVVRGLGDSGIAFFGCYSGDGKLEGLVTYAVECSPGKSPAEVFFEDVAFLDTNVLVVELGGTTPGDEFDRLVVEGEATLAGALEVRLLDGFMPEPGDEFEFLTFGSLSGVFDAVQGVDLGNGVHLDLVYGTNSLSLNAVPEPPTLLLAAFGLLGLTFYGWRRKR